MSNDFLPIEFEFSPKHTKKRKSTGKSSSGGGLVFRWLNDAWQSISGRVRRRYRTSVESTLAFETLEPRMMLAAEIDVFGNGLSIPDGSSSTSLSNHTYFGPVDVSGGSITRTFTVRNVGNSGTIGLIYDSNNDIVSTTGWQSGFFEIITQPHDDRLRSGESTTFQVRFDPPTAGDWRTNIYFQNSDSDESPYTFQIAGRGVESPPEAPGTPNLRPSDDTGFSSTDNITYETEDLSFYWGAATGATKYFYEWNDSTPNIETTNTGINIDAPSQHGWHTFYVRAWNSAGYSASRSLDVFIDRENPTLTVPDLRSSDDTGRYDWDNHTRDLNIRFDWQGDHDLGIHEYKIEWNDPSPDTSTTNNFVNTGAPTSNGTGTFYVQAVSPSGLTRLRQTNVIFDTIAPGNSAPTAPSGFQSNNSPTITWNTASSNDWKTDVFLEQRINGSGSWNSVPGWPQISTTTSIATSNLDGENEYRAYIRRTDVAGNVGSTSAPTYFTVFEAPQIDLSVFNPNPVSPNETATIEWETSGTVHHVALYLRQNGSFVDTSLYGVTGGEIDGRIDADAWNISDPDGNRNWDVFSSLPLGEFQIQLVAFSSDDPNDVVTDDIFIDFTVARAPLVTSFGPPQDDLQYGEVDHAVVRFDQAINSATFTKDDVTLTRDGVDIPITSVEKLTGNLSFRINFPVQFERTDYSVVIGPNIENSSGQNMNAPYNGTFTIDAGFHAPVLVTPVNGSTDVSLSPQFRWQAVNGANAYRILIATTADALPTGGDNPDENDSRILLNQVTDSTTFDLAFLLNRSKDFSWQVRAGNSADEIGGVWSDPWSFRTQAFSGFDSPSYLLGQSVDENTTIIHWDNVQNADSYSLWRSIDPESEFEEIYHGSEKKFIDQELDAGTKYYYKVRANFSNGQSVFTQSLNVTAETAPTRPVVALVTPNDGELNVGETYRIEGDAFSPSGISHVQAELFRGGTADEHRVGIIPPLGNVGDGNKTFIDWLVPSRLDGKLLNGDDYKIKWVVWDNNYVAHAAFSDGYFAINGDTTEHSTPWNRSTFDYYQIGGQDRSFYYNGNHLGADIYLAEGTPIHAALDGTVRFFGKVNGNTYGTLVVAVESPLDEPTTFTNAYGDEVTTDKIIMIYGHMRPTSGFDGQGTSVYLQDGQEIKASDLLGYIERSSYPDGGTPDWNGDGLEHLHLGLRLQSFEQALDTDGSLWMRGYEQDTNFGVYFADPIVLLGLNENVPERPNTPLVSSNSTNGIQVSWNIAGNTSDYYLERREVGDTSWQQIYFGSDSQRFDSNQGQLETGKSYVYRVRGKNLSGFGEYSRISDSVSLPNAAPDNPTGLTVEIENGYTRLTWEAVDGADGYLVERSLTPGFEDSEKFQVDVTTVLDNSRNVFNVTYYYRVSAYNNEFLSQPSTWEGSLLPGISDTFEPTQLPDHLYDEYHDIAQLFRWNWFSSIWESVSIDQTYQWSWDAPTIMLTHGWNDKVDFGDPNEYIEQFASNLSQRSENYQHMNVFAVDWHSESFGIGSDPNNLGTGSAAVIADLGVYVIAKVAQKKTKLPIASFKQTKDWEWSADNAFRTARLLGVRLSDAGVNPDNMMLIGHSNGGGFMSELAITLHQRTNIKVDELVGLDTPWATSAFGKFIDAASVVNRAENYYVPLVQNDGTAANFDLDFSFGFGAPMFTDTDGVRISNIELDNEISESQVPSGLMHSKIPQRYASSAQWHSTAPWGFLNSGFNTQRAPEYTGGLVRETDVFIEGAKRGEFDISLNASGYGGYLSNYFRNHPDYPDNSVRIFIDPDQVGGVNTISVTGLGNTLFSDDVDIYGEANSPVYAETSILFPAEATFLNFQLIVLDHGNGDTLQVIAGDKIRRLIALSDLVLNASNEFSIPIDDLAGTFAKVAFYMPSDEASDAEFVISNPVIVAEPDDEMPLVVNSSIQLVEGQTETLRLSDLSATDPDTNNTELIFELITTPSHGDLLFDGLALTTGGSFSTQAILDGLVALRHDGSNTTTDAFVFKVYDPALNETEETSFDITIIPVDDEPTVELTLSANSGSEAAGTVITLTANASANVIGDQTVDVSVDGLGITAGDFLLSSNQITILDGQSSGSITLTILDDDLVEAAEIANITISNPSSGILLGTEVSDTLDIDSDDTATFTIDDITVNEDVGELTFNITLDSPIDMDVDVDVIYSDGTATGSLVDYDSATDTVTFAAETLSQTVSVTIVNDLISENAETFFAALAINSQTPVGTRLVDATDTATATILDDDAQPQFDFGDAPESYGTLLSANGPRHVLGDLFLGNYVDPESDALTSTAGLGDDLDGRSDEDGITFLSPAIPGQPLDLLVFVSRADARFASWIDFNQSGTFEPGERVFRTLAAAGSHRITIDVPSDAVLGQTYSRFRVADTAAESAVPTGLAFNGEVEDYPIEIVAAPPTLLDYGDAPNSYRTLLADNGPRHIPGDLYFGAAPGVEFDGLPEPNAQGDDILDMDDEDGILLTSAAIPGQPLEFAVTVSRADGRFTAWFDLDQSGSFDGDERFFRVLDTAGTHFFSVDVPSDAPLGKTFARFRIADTAAESGVVGGLANNGEVEDLSFEIRETAPPAFDFGDAPETYTTSLRTNGPRHIPGDLYFGTAPDVELDGFPQADAQGDDSLNQNDEDGIVLTSAAIPGQTLEFAVNVSRADGRFAAWFDFDQSGTFELDERFFRVLSTAGTHFLSVDVPVDAQLGQTFARFRIADTAAESGVVGGLANNGEVEDIQFEVTDSTPQGFDFGDAPESYRTSILANGPRHIPGDLYLGSAPDSELDGFPSADALGDDILNLDDEDGITFTSAAIPGQTLTFTVNVSRANGRFAGWFDFDQSGTFELDERIFRVLATPGDHFLSIPVPADALLGSTFARFRIADTAAESAVVGGLANNGEVEDFQFEIIATLPDLNLAYGSLPSPWFDTSTLLNRTNEAVPVAPVQSQPLVLSPQQETALIDEEDLEFRYTDLIEFDRSSDETRLELLDAMIDDLIEPIIV